MEVTEDGHEHHAHAEPECNQPGKDVGGELRPAASLAQYDAAPATRRPAVAMPLGRRGPAGGGRPGCPR